MNYSACLLLRDNLEPLKSAQLPYTYCLENLRSSQVHLHLLQRERASAFSVWNILAISSADPFIPLENSMVTFSSQKVKVLSLRSRYSFGHPISFPTYPGSSPNKPKTYPTTLDWFLSIVWMLKNS